MIRVADYVMARCAAAGLRRAFLVTGGAAMFLNDALRRETAIAHTCMHHEQAAAMAAEGYARVSGRPAIVSVSSGPGAINALNGVFGAWTDSLPMIVVSGQVKRETAMGSYPGLRVRQLGDQEVDIVPMVKGITKFATCLNDPGDVRCCVERALWLATHGRQGPVWLDIPVDVQSCLVDEAALCGYDPGAEPATAVDDVAAMARVVLDRLAAAERPVILAGSGVRLAGATDTFRAVVARLGMPVTTAWTHDLLSTDDPLWCGRPGTIGDRAGNFVVQSSDTLLVLGSRLNIRQTGYDWAGFAADAYKIQVDVDAGEMDKPTVRADLRVVADLADFLEALAAELDRRAFSPGRHAGWLAWCRQRVARYPMVREHQRTTAPPINPYHFMEELFGRIGAHDVVVTGNGAACVMAFQAARLGGGQRLFSNSGAASMGYDLPAALGAAAAVVEEYGESAVDERPKVVCLAGDGSLQMNVQEMQTLATTCWPVKIFVLDNGGYLSIRSTQRAFFDGRIGESRASGLELPDYVAVAAAYGLPALRLTDPATLAETIGAVLAGDGPCLCQVVVDPEQGFEPRVRSRQRPDGAIESPALDDLYPFLEREELAENRISGARDTPPGRPGT
ncbi:MAG: thiamine pyrophosphate-binding protein [Thermoleophilia bacterium]|jgi:acetolactate synthase-1/2/3 large subunit